MSFVYVVVEKSDDPTLEGGGVYSTAYKTFEDAKAAVITKYQTVLDDQMKLERGEDETSPMEMVDVPAPKTETGFASLYIEKGINIYIHKLPINMSGGKRSFSKTQKTRKTQKSKMKKIQ